MAEGWYFLIFITLVLDTGMWKQFVFLRFDWGTSRYAWSSCSGQSIFASMIWCKKDIDLVSRLSLSIFLIESFEENPDLGKHYQLKKLNTWWSVFEFPRTYQCIRCKQDCNNCHCIFHLRTNKRVIHIRCKVLNDSSTSKPWLLRMINPSDL